MARPDLLPSRGAIAEPLLMEVAREITSDDLRRLAEGGAPKVTVPILQKLRATHHKQAALLAQGKSLTEVAAIVGCTTQRLVQLQADPTFTELVSYYHDQMMMNLLDDASRLQGKIVDLGEQAVDEMLDRMDDPTKRAAMRIGDVRQIAEFAMDRTVAPPKAAPNASVPPAAITINFGTPLRDVSDTAGGKLIEGELSDE